MHLPPRLQAKLMGQCVSIASGLRIRGRIETPFDGVKTAALSDQPAFYLYDAGGPFSSERVCAQEQVDSRAHDIIFADDSRVFRGNVEFDPHTVAWVEFTQGVSSIADVLQPPQGVQFATPRPVSMRAEFALTRLQFMGYLQEQAPDYVDRLDAAGPTKKVIANPYFWVADAIAPEARALVEHLDGGEMYADVVVDGQRQLRLFQPLGRARKCTREVA